MSSVVQRVVEAGGFTTRAALVAATSRADVDAALVAGEIVADGRGRYATPATDVAVRAAHRLSGVLTLTSAALHHGWEVVAPPDLPQVAVPRNRKVSAERRVGVDLRYTPLEALDVVDDIVLSEEATLRMCLAHLPRREALVIADSALRHGVALATVRRAALTATGPGAPQARWVAAHADGRSAGPFESALRDICVEVPGLSVEPQVTLRSDRITARPDLVDADLGVAVEADSFEFRGDRAGLVKDARRYNLLVVEGWLVLRFTYEDVMFDPDYVREVLVAIVALVQRRAGSSRCTCRSA